MQEPEALVEENTTSNASQYGTQNQTEPETPSAASLELLSTAELTQLLEAERNRSSQYEVAPLCLFINKFRLNSRKERNKPSSGKKRYQRDLPLTEDGEVDFLKAELDQTRKDKAKIEEKYQAERKFAYVALFNSLLMAGLEMTVRRGKKITSRR